MKLDWNPGISGSGEAAAASSAGGAPSAKPPEPAGGTQDAIRMSTLSSALGQLSASIIARVGSGAPAASSTIARSIVNSALRGY